ncbi:fatty acid synthase-like [Uloborus diversus]|uniref:fatty acid synthase-like n=1 Tax=Uloborus diversus TaxID=327109 RepID=UPI00240982EE|nr:fatty acid synthase-like [Uloborus diversus]
MNLEAEHHEYCSDHFSPDDIVISGVAGRFPTVDNVGQLKDALFKKMNLIVPSNERYPKGTLKLPFSSSGIINDVDKFDNEFFGISSECTHLMDPSLRKTIEVCYEAIFDSGYDPYDLKGCNIGVYHGIVNQDGKEMFIYTRAGGLEVNNLAVSCLRAMNANLFSSINDFHAPEAQKKEVIRKKKQQMETFSSHELVDDEFNTGLDLRFYESTRHSKHIKRRI